MNPKLNLALVALLAAILAGCSGTPSDSTGRKLIQRRIESQSKGNIKLVGFAKTNATGSRDMYNMEYEAEIEFSENGAWGRGDLTAALPSFEFTPTDAKGRVSIGLLGQFYGVHPVRKGEREKVKGSLLFEKTERGWRGPDGNVY